jgi:replicative DNA helicase
LYKALIAKLGTITLNAELIGHTLSTVRTKQIAGQLATEAWGVATGEKSLDDLSQVYSKLDNLSILSLEEPDEANFVTDDLETLYQETIATPGLRWRLQTLNRILGSLRKGDFGFVFARPETGKTTFLASELTFFASQTNQPILWFNNEEQGNKVKIRAYQAALGVQLYELMANRTGNQEKYYEATGGNIRLFDSASIHRKKVEALCKSLKPGLIVFDQIDKLKGFSSDREDLRLGEIYTWARELSKEYCPIIGVCQAGATAEGKKYLTMDDVNNAKTSKQSEADFIIGIGKSHDADLEYIRHFSICKNKLQGDQDTVPELRHGRAEVRIFPELARYEDIL